MMLALNNTKETGSGKQGLQGQRKAGQHLHGLPGHLDVCGQNAYIVQVQKFRQVHQDVGAVHGPQAHRVAMHGQRAQLGQPQQGLDA